MPQDKRWTKTVRNTITSEKRMLSNLSVKVRTDQYQIFKKLLKPTKNTKILDVGVSSEELLADTNMFEKNYPYLDNLTLATIENTKALKKLYPKCKVVQIAPGKKLPFKNNQFDITVSWATLEHVGGYSDQERFLNELLRVSKKIFVTTPYRGCIYEPHSGLFFAHWLPLPIFRNICKKLGKNFWATEKNLNPLFIKDIKLMFSRNKTVVKIYKMFGVMPSHLMIYRK